MAKKTFIVAHPNLHLAVMEEGKRVLKHVELNSEYTAEEKDVANLVKSKKLIIPEKAKKAESPSQDDKKTK